MNHNHRIYLGSPGEDISVKDIRTVIQRFKHINKLRLDYIHTLLQKRQHVFLSLLPLIFHHNHALLPGFVSLETPAGILDYKPTIPSIRAVRKWVKNFSYRRKALTKYSIQGIYLMGSVSSIAFSKSSDMDIWLCHEAELTNVERAELQQKATNVEIWADSLNLEVHFFLIDNNELSEGKNAPISEESNGDTQHYLLLEEFYRTSIFIAGRVPAWWIVPPEQEHNYSAYLSHLVDNRFIDEKTIIDFGGLESIPAEEFISGTLWHIYKSIESPYKSLLKLFLMECYASEYPQPQWLCFELKNAVYAGEVDVLKLDPYLLIYSKIETYLQSIHSVQRIELVRLCFYLKIMGDSKQTLDIESQHFRAAYMESIAKQWQWSEGLLTRLNKQRYWDIKKAIDEHTVIKIQLKRSLRIIIKLAGRYVGGGFDRSNKDLRLIARKLYTFLEVRPHKVEILTTRHKVSKQEKSLSIVESMDGNKKTYWSLYLGEQDLNNPLFNICLKRESRLLNLLGWIVVNGLYHHYLQVNITTYSRAINSSTLNQLLKQLHRYFESHFNNDASLTPYQRADKQTASFWLINFGESISNERNDAFILLSDRSDPLSYGNHQQCFIQTLTQISISKWGEIATAEYTGLEGFFSGLIDSFNQSEQPFIHYNFKVACYTLKRGKSIYLRAESIFNILVQCFSTQLYDKNGTLVNNPYFLTNRYIVAGEALFYLFYMENKRLTYRSLESEADILIELQRRQTQFSVMTCDENIISDIPFSILSKLNEPLSVQLLFLLRGKHLTVFIMDEKGSLYMQEYINTNTHHVLNNYYLFLTAVLKKISPIQPITLGFYEIVQEFGHTFSVYSSAWIQPVSSELPLYINVEHSLSDIATETYDIYYDGRVFDFKRYGDSIFKEATEYIINHRHEQNKYYPVYITDINAPYTLLGAESEQGLQTNHYLSFRRKIERKFNKFVAIK